MKIILIITFLIFLVFLGYKPSIKTVNALEIRQIKTHEIEPIVSTELSVVEFKEEWRSCRATWYGNGFDGRPTASGEIFNQWGFSAASLDYKLGTNLLVCTAKDCVTLKVNDKGHLKDCLDLSRGAFNKLGNESQGVLNVKVKVI